MLSQKGFAPILIVLGIALIGLIGGGVYYYRSLPQELSSNPDSLQEVKDDTKLDEASLESSETSTLSANIPSDWKTYSNRDLGYLIQYPPVWTVDESPQAGCGTVFRTAEGPWVSICGAGGKTLSEIEKDSEMTCIFLSDPTTCSKGTNRTYVSVNGNQSYQYETTEKVNDKFILTTSVMNSYTPAAKFPQLRIDYTGFTKSKYEEKLPLFKTMLSSLKFIDPSQVNTSSWRIYTSTKHGYSIMYPDHLKYESDDIKEDYLQNKVDIHVDRWTSPEGTIFIYSYPDGANLGLQFYATTKTEEQIEVASQKVKKLVGIEVDSEKGTLIWIDPVKNKGMNYKINYSTGNQIAKPENLADFDKVVSSFKFTNP